MNALSQDEVNDILRNRDIAPMLQVYTDAIPFHNKKRKTCPITQARIGRNETCIELDNQTYSVNAFKQYYDLEKEKKQHDSEYQMVSPYRNPITPVQESYLDQFFSRLNEPNTVTRGQNKQRKTARGLVGGKKSRKRTTSKKRNPRRKSRKQRSLL
jgi:hypothetical protein